MGTPWGRCNGPEQVCFSIAGIYKLPVQFTSICFTLQNMSVLLEELSVTPPLLKELVKPLRRGFDGLYSLR